MISDHTDIHQWHYIGTNDNPVDYSSRDINVANDQAVQKWFQGPSFQWKPEAEWTIQDNKGRILQDDPEIKEYLQIHCISTEQDILEALESRITSWYRRVLQEMDKEKLQSFMKALSGDWFTCLEKEPSYASHMGGVWERCQICSARSILSSPMQTHGRSLVMRNHLQHLWQRQRGNLEFPTFDN